MPPFPGRWSSADQLLQHGGYAGVRDESALESALARRAYQPESDLPTLAAAYGYGLAKAHGYSDGNKRIAFVAIYTFLALNGLEITASQEQVVETTLAVADGSMDEDDLARWLVLHTEPIGGIS
ncbi:MAG: type II toxin-antitoxin system death-on-curing family toxin [Armatimonadetes bacterium]|nr:type II toxin-antitoxin system death-on-curing family toxin [Armatimonadota bacterium]